MPDAGGSAGDGAGEAGDPAGGMSGAGGSCQDLCTAQAPACCTTELRCVETVPSCRIDVLDGHVGTAYEYDALVQDIAALSGDVLLTIPDTDIVAAAVDPPKAARMTLQLSKAASIANIATLVGYFNQPFRVSCNDVELFVGVFYMKEGAAAIGAPVIHVAPTPSDDVVLEVGAAQGVWTFGDSGITDEQRDRIDRPELRETFCARGILGVLPEP